MNTKITWAAAFLAASAVYAASTFTTWDGNDGLPQVQTGLDNGTQTSGYWFSYGDTDDGGGSKVVWPVKIGTDDSDQALDSVITHCKGVCGTASLAKGTLTYPPFVGIGFNIVGEGDNGNPEAADATPWGGLCITYESQYGPELELGLGDFDTEIQYANPVVSLAKATTAPLTKAIPWSEFKQPVWYRGDTKITGPEAAKRLVAIKFKIQANEGDYTFNIKKIGPYVDCSLDDIKTIRSASSAKAILSGRTLGFTGVNTATAEVINLQGQVVAKQAINNKASTINLKTLDAGIYMVRVTGKSVNFSNKIVLK